MRITIICENTVGRRIGLGEHGFSALIKQIRGIISLILAVVIRL